MNHFYLHIPFICLLSIQTLFAQQEPTFSSQAYHALHYNPALTGAGGSNSFYLGHRQQWIGFEHAPSSQLLLLSTAPFAGRPIGIGAVFSNDKAFLMNRTSGALTGAVHIVDQAEHRFSLGLMFGFISHRWDFSREFIEKSDSDPLIAGISDFSQTTLDAGLGLHYSYTREQTSINLGAAISQLPGTSIDSIQYALSRHLMLSASWKFALSQQFALEPGLLMRGLAGDRQTGGGGALFYLRAHLKERLWAAVSYQAGTQGIGLSMGVFLDNQQKLYFTATGANQGTIGRTTFEGGVGYTFSSRTLETREAFWRNADLLQQRLNQSGNLPEQASVSVQATGKTVSPTFEFADEDGETYFTEDWPEVLSFVTAIRNMLNEATDKTKAPSIHQIDRIEIHAQLLESQAALTSGADVEYGGEWGPTLVARYERDGDTGWGGRLIRQGAIDKEELAFLKLYGLRQWLSRELNIPEKNMDISIDTDNPDMEYLRRTRVRLHLKEK